MIPIWLRSNSDKSFNSGIGVVWNSIKHVFDTMKINYVLENPNAFCIELWVGWDWKSENNGNFKIGFTTGESFIKDCGEGFFNVYFVPTRYFQELRKQEGYNVWQWKYGISPDEVPYIERNWNNEFIFSHVGIPQYRKGSKLVCEAFTNEFDKSENVFLDIVTSGESEEYLLLKDIYECSQIRFKSLVLDRREIWQKYQGHCLVFPSLREGWGLHLAEALATGMPAIVSDLRIFDDQFNDTFGWWLSLSDKSSGIFKNIPDVGDLQKKMRYAYSNREECRAKGRIASDYCHRYLTWEYGVKNDFLRVLSIYGFNT